MKGFTIKDAQTIAAYLNLISRRGYGPGVDALMKAWGQAFSVGGDFREFTRVLALGQDYAALNKDKWLADKLGRIMSLLHRRNPLSPRADGLIEQMAIEHEADSREHASKTLKSFDLGTSYGLREAAAIARKNPLDPHGDKYVGEFKGVSIYRNIANGMYFARGYGAADTLAGMKQAIHADKTTTYVLGREAGMSHRSAAKQARRNPAKRKPAFGTKEWQDAMMSSISDKIRRGELLSASDNNFLKTMEAHELRHFGKSIIPQVRELYKSFQERSVLAGKSGLRKRVAEHPRLNPMSKTTYMKGRNWTEQFLSDNPQATGYAEDSVVRSAYALMKSNGQSIPRTEAAWDDFYEGAAYALAAWKERDPFHGNPQGKGSPAGGGREGRPPKGAVLVGRRIKAVEYYDAPKAKAEGLKNPNMPWRHDYKVGGKVYGLPDGSVLIKHPKGKKLWGYR